MEDELASQILMEEADDSLTNLPRQRGGYGKGGGRNNRQQHAAPQHLDHSQNAYSGGGGGYGSGWAPRKVRQNNVNAQHQNQRNNTDGSDQQYAGGYWGQDRFAAPDIYRQVPQQQNRQQHQQQDMNMGGHPFFYMNPWAMQQAAASAMMQMGKDPLNPQHWVQMAGQSTGGMWQEDGGKAYSQQNFNQGMQQPGGMQSYNQNQQQRMDDDTSHGKRNQNRRRRKKQRDQKEEETPLPPNCSPLLKDFRTKNKKLELQDIKWNIIEFATDQYGSRFIQQKLETATEEEKQMLEVAVLNDFQNLTTDVFGNYVVQKMFEYGSASQRRNLAEQLVGDVLKQSLQMYGCRVIQKALESVSVEQQTLLVGELKNHVIQLVEDQNGNHVIQKCIERMPPEKIQFIVNAFKGCVQRMASHCYGCRVLQRLIEHCTPPQQVAPILDEIARYIPQLSQDQYGNYVVQHMLEHGRANDRRLILEVVRSQILMLSCHKFASNVVEKAMICSSDEERDPIMAAVVGEPSDVNPALLTMMRDRYGNYIVQRLLDLTTGEQKKLLTWRLKDQIRVLKKFTYGKHIVQILEAEEEEENQN